MDHQRTKFFDPLRSSDEKEATPLSELEDEENNSTASTSSAVQYSGQEWYSFKKLLMQRFPVPKMVSLSSTSSATIKGVKGMSYFSFLYTYISENMVRKIFSPLLGIIAR